MTDLDADGSFDSTGEVATCVADAAGTNFLCPTAATACVTPVPPPAPSTCPLAGGSACDTSDNCTAPVACNFLFSVFGMHYYQCPTTGALTVHTTKTTAQNLCNASCSQTAACTPPPPPPPAIPTCPTDSALACIDDGTGTTYCNANACVDETTAAVDMPISTEYLQNDAVDPVTGQCNGTMMLFNGRPMDCWKAGWVTLNQNCCKNKGAVQKDSTGTLAQASLAVDAIVGAYNVALTAYTAYASTGSALAAADAGATYMSFAVDPTTLAVAVAVAVILDYMATVCQDHGMETAMLNGSGFCHEISTYCVKEVANKCVQRAKNFCCFESKLARIIQEQGRPQLKSFAVDMWFTPGNPKQPNCRGFTPDEFANLDFSLIDLSEYVGDLRHEALTNVNADMQNATDKFTNSLQ